MAQQTSKYGGVSEQADESDLKSAVGYNVWVQIPSPPPVVTATINSPLSCQPKEYGVGEILIQDIETSLKQC